MQIRMQWSVASWKSASPTAALNRPFTNARLTKPIVEVPQSVFFRIGTSASRLPLLVTPLMRRSLIVPVM